MKESVYSKDGMKQIIDSGWKEFDKQTNCIFAGQVWANTQFSMCVRPWKETECNGFTNPEGHLMEFDMDYFNNYHIPERIRQLLTDKKRERSVILYMFSTTDRSGRRNPFCWVVTGYDYKLIDYCVVCGYGQRYDKRHKAAQEAISYITE